MNWYKFAQHDLTDFADRNIVNAKIDDLVAISTSLIKMSKLVFQTGSVTKGMLKKIFDGKSISSYPTILDLLKAADRICLDSPHKFAEICIAAVGEVNQRIKRLEKLRKEFTTDTLPNRSKKWSK